MSDYNYDGFDAKDYELDKSQGPMPGDKAPDYALQTVSGETVQLLDFDGDFLVLEMGSTTCPLFQSRRAKMASLSEEFPNVSHAVLYVREAHPGIAIPSHKTMADKTACAADMGEVRQVLIDDLEGRAHEGFGHMPNASFIINKAGCVVYRSGWNNPGATAKALRKLLAGRAVRSEGWFVPPKPPVAFETFKAAGKGSAVDFFRSLPVLFWKNLIKRNLRLLFGMQAGIAPDHSC